MVTKMGSNGCSPYIYSYSFPNTLTITRNISVRGITPNSNKIRMGFVVTILCGQSRKILFLFLFVWSLRSCKWWAHGFSFVGACFPGCATVLVRTKVTELECLCHHRIGFFQPINAAAGWVTHNCNTVQHKCAMVDICYRVKYLPPYYCTCPAPWTFAM